INNRSTENMFSKKTLKIRFLLIDFDSAHAQKKPNIMIFIIDDMGWQDTSYHFADQTTDFNKKYNTPNMEKLAQEEMSFTDAYSTPVCTPTRVSLITGMNASRHHVTNWTAPFKDNPTGNQDEQMEEPEWNHNGMSPIP